MSKYKSWEENRKQSKNKIKTFEVDKDDRIKTATQIGFIQGALADSVLGWAEWVTKWIGIELNKKIDYEDEHEALFDLNDNELAEIHNQLKDFTLKFIDIDLKLGKIMNKKIAKYNKTHSESTRNPENDRKMIS